MKTPSLTPYRLLYFAEFMAIGVYIAYFNLYLAEERGLGKASIGILLAIPMIGKCVVPMIWGRLGDRFSVRKPLLRVAALTNAVVFAVFPFLETFSAIVVAILLYTAIGTLTIPFIESLTFMRLGERIDLYPQAKLLSPVGFLFGTLAFGAVIAVTDLSRIFIALPMLYLAVFVASFFLNPETVAAKEHAGSWRDLLGRLARPDVLAFFAVITLIRLSYGPFTGYFSIYIHDAGAGTLWIGLFFSISVISEVLGHRFLFPKLVHQPTGRLLAVASLITVAQWLLFAAPFHTIRIAVAMGLNGISFGLLHVAAITRVNTLFPEPHRTAGQTLFSGIYYGIGGGLGILAAGILVRWIDFQKLFLIAAGIAVLAIFFGRKLKNS